MSTNGTLKNACVLLLVTAVCAGCVSSGDKDYHGRVTGHTPYDMKYQRVREYLEKASSFTYLREDAYTVAVSAAFPYITLSRDPAVDEWQLPFETEEQRSGDCEDKAIWLYSRLIQAGFDDVRLTIGKLYRYDSNAHAWVTWYPEPGEIFILDPTNEDTIRDACTYTAEEYIPHYSFYRGKRWVHRQERYSTAALGEER